MPVSGKGRGKGSPVSALACCYLTTKTLSWESGDQMRHQLWNGSQRGHRSCLSLSSHHPASPLPLL